MRTFRELRDTLNTLSDQQLDSDTTFFESVSGEFVSPIHLDFAGPNIPTSEGVLDEGHPFFYHG
jgi:hypothetical protein